MKIKKKDQWKQVRENLNSQMDSDPHLWRKALALSYNHLHDHLKPCFLYFGALPEDFQTLIVEGFIRNSGEKRLEDVAKEYLMDLIGRSLIIVSRRAYDDGIKACSVHDLLRDFYLKKAKEEH
ncbi:hypothetical protein ACSBR2_039476 [Camellia fascicularis]